MGRFIFFLIFLVLLGGGGYWAYKNGIITLPQKSEDKLAGITARVERHDIDSTLLITGEVSPEFQVEVKAEVGGKLKQIAVKPGAVVKKGDLLAVINDKDIQTEKATAETEIAGSQLSMEKNKGNYTRAKALFEQKLISKEIFDNLRAEYEISENNLEKSRTKLLTILERLEKTLILAPTDGTVLSIPVSEGQVVTAAASVNAGTLIMDFADVDRLLIKTHVNQVDGPRLKIGHDVQVNVWGGGDKPLTAKVSFIAPLASVKNNVKGFAVEATITNNEGDFLKPGMSVSMNIPIAKAQNVIAVPVSAIFRDRRTTLVYVRKDIKLAPEKRIVEMGVSDNNFVEIRSGLDEGEEILLAEPPEEVVAK